jgi:hypothetical protein
LARTRSVKAAASAALMSNKTVMTNIPLNFPVSFRFRA